MTRIERLNQLARQTVARMRANIDAHKLNDSETNALLEAVISALIYAMVRKHKEPILEFGKLVERIGQKLAAHLASKVE